MMAILDKQEGKAVHAILQEIARTYPQVNYTLIYRLCNVKVVALFQLRHLNVVVYFLKTFESILE